MLNDVSVFSTDRKLVIVDEERFLCDIIYHGKVAYCRGENMATGEKTDWLEFADIMNAAFRFGDYIKNRK